MGQGLASGHLGEALDEGRQGRRPPLVARRVGTDAGRLVRRPERPVERRSLVAREAARHGAGEPADQRELGGEGTLASAGVHRQRVEPTARAELDVGPAERLGQPAVVAERVDAHAPGSRA